MRGSVPMSARPRASAWGLGFITSGDDWRLQAACRDIVDPDLFFNPHTRDVALHICHRHCPVIADCFLFAKADPPVDCVMGGVAWRVAAGGKGSRHGKPRRNDTTPARRCELCHQGKPELRVEGPAQPPTSTDSGCDE